MTRLTTLISRRCCGGPVLILSLVFGLLGLMFASLSAVALGWVFMGTGIATFGLCMLLGQSRCPRLRGPVRFG